MNNFEPKLFLSMGFFTFFFFLFYKKFWKQPCQLPDDEEPQIKNQIKIIVKYEDKYLDKLKMMPNEYSFSVEERLLEANKYREFLDSSQELHQELILAQNKAKDEAKKHVINLLLDRLSICFIIVSQQPN